MSQVCGWDSDDMYVILMFLFPCITSTITIDNQQDATILIYLL